MNCTAHRMLMFLVSMGLAAGVAGCAGHASRSHGVAGGEDRVAQHAGVAELSIEPGAYERAFAIARERLMDYRFAIDRVDARRGVITTHPKRTAGLASPWDQEQSGLGQEWEDLINEQRRVVRIEFDLEDGEASSMSVTVELLRTHRPGWRVESESVRLSTHARTRDELGRIEPASYTERIGLDARFAERLAWSIEASLRE